MPPYRNRTTTIEAGRHYNDNGLFSIVTGASSIENKNLYLGYEGHYGYPNFPPDRNVGGAFRCESRYTNLGWASVGNIWRGGPSGAYYIGKVAAQLGLSGGINGGWREPDPYGAEAYNRLKPTKPDFSVLNFIYELKDLPSMLRARHQKLADIGSYYLALKFGWEPLLRDIRDLVQMQQNAQKRLAQLIRDNGRSVRRRVHLFDNELENVTVTGSGYGALTPIFDTWMYSKVPVYSDRRTVHDKCWASGRFKYHLPPGPRDINWTASMMRRIYGATPSPAVLWNAIPYSWLIDWFSNAGDVIENLDAGVADRLAADYCYIMREAVMETSREATGWFKRKTGEEVSVTSTSIGRTRYMTRVPGSPFGFNISENSLTGMQLSILGALGLSRLR